MRYTHKINYEASRFTSGAGKLLLFTALVTLISPKPVAANTNVDISNNGSGSNSRVNVNNVVNTTTNTGSNNSNSTTDIRIETNGEVKEYHGTGDQNVTLESGNGNNSVKITNNTGSNSVTPTGQVAGETSDKAVGTVTPAATPAATATASPVPAINFNAGNLPVIIMNLVQKIFSGIFSLIFRRT